jgi:hypothetical protein
MASNPGSAASSAAADSWQSLEAHALERLHVRSRWLILLFSVTGIPYVYSALYLAGDSSWARAREPVAAVLICTFVLAYLRFIKRVSVRVLDQLRPVVPIPDELYQRYARLILHADPRVELALAVVALVAVVTLGGGDYGGLPQKPLDWLPFLLLYLYGGLVLWIILSLIYHGLRSSLGLRALAQSPLIVNAFDSTGLLPFGRLAALHSLATVTVMSIPLLLMGPPTGGGGYFVLVLSFFSLGVLFVPLWGVHRQIVRTREQVLNSLSDDLLVIQRQLLAADPPQLNVLRTLYEDAERLAGLRKLVLAGPSWPFRDYGTVARVVTAVFLPTLVAFLSLVVENVVFPILRP